LVSGSSPFDRWKYRTPNLRNVALTAPHMHDGSLATLGDVVSFYSRGGTPNEVLDPLIRPLGLSVDDQDDLVSFLEALTGSDVDELVSDAFAAPIGDPREPVYPEDPIGASVDDLDYLGGLPRRRLGYGRGPAEYDGRHHGVSLGDPDDLE
jgi:hypothetical protein